MTKKIAITSFCFLISINPCIGSETDSIPDEVMSEILVSSRSVMRANIAKVRGALKTRSLVRRLISELQSPSRDRRNLAGCALKEFRFEGTQDGTAEALRLLLQRDPEGISSCAAEAAVDVNKPLHITLKEAPALLRLSPNYDQYVWGPLAQIGEPVVPLLIKNLSNPNPYKKQLAISVLSQLGARAIDAKEPLRNLLRDKISDTDVGAAYALFQIDPEDSDALKTLVRSIHEKRGNTYWTAKALEKKKNLPEVRRAIEESARAQSPPPDDIEGLLGVLETQTGPNDPRHLQASYKLSELMRNSKNRNLETRNRLMKLARNEDYRMHDPAFDCLMHFKGDSDVRKLLIETLHGNPDESTRGKTTGRLMINTDHDAAVFPELEKALRDPSEFVRVRSAQDLARQGNYAGVPLVRKILSEIPLTPQDDHRIGTAARAAGDMRHKDLLVPLRKLIALGKAAPYSSREAASAIWLTELRLETDRQGKMAYIRKIAETERGLYWIEGTLLWNLDALDVPRDGLVNLLSELSVNSDSRISHIASEAKRRLERMSKP